jgi:limonene-1,2-epoxide hydrolase
VAHIYVLVIDRNSVSRTHIRANTHAYIDTRTSSAFDSRVDRRVFVGQQVHAKRVKGIKIGPSIIYFTFTGTLSKRDD